MHILGKKREKGTTLVLHVGSSSVGGMVIRHSKDDKIEIVAHSKIPTNFLLDVDFQAFWRSVNSSLKKALTEITKTFTGRPDLVVCVFTSPWFISQTKIACIKREENFVTDEDLLNKLVKNEIEIFLRHWQGNMDPLGGEANLIEYKIMKVNLNGYPTKKPLNKATKSLEAYIYISLGVNEVMETIKSEISKTFGNTPLQFHTFPFAAFNVLSQIINTEEGLLFTELGGDTTDLSIVRKNIIEETVSFKLGKNHLIRKIASDMKTMIEEAPSMLESYRNGQSNEEISKKINEIVTSARNEWLKLLDGSLKMISENFPLPQNFYIIGNDSIIQELTKDLEDNQDLAKYTVFEKPFHITRVKSDALESFFSNKEFYDMKKDVFLTMEAIFADKFTGKEENKNG